MTGTRHRPCALALAGVALAAGIVPAIAREPAPAANPPDPRATIAGTYRLDVEATRKNLDAWLAIVGNPRGERAEAEAVIAIDATCEGTVWADGRFELFCPRGDADGVYLQTGLWEPRAGALEFRVLIEDGKRLGQPDSVWITYSGGALVETEWFGEPRSPVYGRVWRRTGDPVPEDEKPPRDPGVRYYVTIRSGQEFETMLELGATPVSPMYEGAEVEFDVPKQAIARLPATKLPHRPVPRSLQGLARQQVERQRKAKPSRCGEDFFWEYRDYAEIGRCVCEWIRTNDAAHFVQILGPSECRPNEDSPAGIRKSLEEREIYGLRIAEDAAELKPSVVIVGGQHAREWISPMVSMYVAYKLLNDSTVRPLLKGTDFYVVPVLNPDGYVYSFDPELARRLWRKNRRTDIWQFDKGAQRKLREWWRAIGRWIRGLDSDPEKKEREQFFQGVDLNRNWSSGFGMQEREDGGDSSHPLANGYRGPSPLSEPETQSLAELLLRVPARALIDFHSFGRLVVFPWSLDPGPQIISEFESGAPEVPAEILESKKTEIKEQLGRTSSRHCVVAQEMARLTGGGYLPILGQENRLGGTVTDYVARLSPGAFAFAIELPPCDPRNRRLDCSATEPSLPVPSEWQSGFVLPAHKILPAAHEIWPAVEFVALRVGHPELSFDTWIRGAEAGEKVELTVWADWPWASWPDRRLADHHADVRLFTCRIDNPYLPERCRPRLGEKPREDHLTANWTPCDPPREENPLAELGLIPSYENLEEHARGSTDLYGEVDFEFAVPEDVCINDKFLLGAASAGVQTYSVVQVTSAEHPAREELCNQQRMLDSARSMDVKSKGTDVDDLRAYEQDYERDAVTDRDPRARNIVGLMWALGRGLPRDEELATQWFRCAAEQDYPEAQYNLGVMYLEGRGVAPDPVEAWAWFTIARQHEFPATREHAAAALRKIRLTLAQQHRAADRIEILRESLGGPPGDCVTTK